MIAKKTLDPDTLKYLEELLSKSSKDLDADEIAFLIARKEYLTEREIDSIPKIEEAKVIKPKAKRKYLK